VSAIAWHVAAMKTIKLPLVSKNTYRLWTTSPASKQGDWPANLFLEDPLTESASPPLRSVVALVNALPYR